MIKNNKILCFLDTQLSKTSFNVLHRHSILLTIQLFHPLSKYIVRSQRIDKNEMFVAFLYCRPYSLKYSKFDFTPKQCNSNKKKTPNHHILS